VHVELLFVVLLDGRQHLLAVVLAAFHADPMRKLGLLTIRALLHKRGISGIPHPSGTAMMDAGTSETSLLKCHSNYLGAGFIP
jgi:hypothetical protein